MEIDDIIIQTVFSLTSIFYILRENHDCLKIKFDILYLNRIVQVEMSQLIILKATRMQSASIQMTWPESLSKIVKHM